METNFKPNYAIHPGEFLKEEMAAMKISQKMLSEKIDVAKTIINEVINGKRKINGELAVKLEQVLYSSAQYWLNLQSLYDEAKAREKLNIPKKIESNKIIPVGWTIIENMSVYKQPYGVSYYNYERGIA